MLGLWEIDQGPTPLSGTLYHASRDMTVELGASSNDYVLILKGALFDKTATCGVTMSPEEDSHLDVLRSWETTMLQTYGYEYSNSDSSSPETCSRIPDVLDHWITRTSTAICHGLLDSVWALIRSLLGTRVYLPRKQGNRSPENKGYLKREIVKDSFHHLEKHTSPADP